MSTYLPNMDESDFLAFSLIMFSAIQVEGVGAQIPTILGTIAEGFDVVLLGYIHISFRTSDDPDPWTGKCNRFSLDHSQ
jgi:hypothetical protein